MNTYPKLTQILTRVLLTISILIVSSFSVYATSNPDTALDEYVNAPDAAFGYQHFGSVPGPGFTVHIFSMTSQQWRTPEEVDRTLWSHWMAVVVPDTVVTETAMLIVAGGSNSELPNLNSSDFQLAGQIAVSTQSIVSVINQIPNQPLIFPDAASPLREDSLVAYSWDKAMRTGDLSWAAYLPMVKSVVRAMDMVQAVTPTVSAQVVSDFVIVGFSKRGATTWLTGVVDPRVKAIAPGAIDFLNLAPHFEHHYSAYGFYSPSLHDYIDYDIARRVRTPEGQDLLKVIDPYSYLDRLTMPKLLINSTGDQFFPSDSGRHYVQELQGDSLVRYVANTDHSLEDPSGSIENALTGLLSWYINIIHDAPRPTISWQKEAGTVTVTAFPPPSVATLWQATNPDARDFRKENIGNAWLPESLPGSNGIYQINVDEPANGWSAYYAEFTYPGIAGLPQVYSTRVFVTPDVLPFEVIDPTGDPKGKGFWSKQIRAAVTGKGKAEVDLATLESYFPVPLFDTYINNVEAAYDLFTSKEHSADNKALQHCLALRLNVMHKELGWYSKVDIRNTESHKYRGRHNRHNDDQSDLLWEFWQTAHDEFLAGEPKQAKRICERINEL